MLRAKEKLSIIIEHWRQIRGLIVKAKYIKDVGDLYERIGDKIQIVAELEFNTIKLLLKRKRILEPMALVKSKQKKIKKKQFSYIYYVQLDDLFNYHRFYDANDSDALKKVGGLEYFFHVDDTVKKQIWEHENLKFYHPVIDGQRTDSISCLGEKITIEPNIYDEIMFMLHGELNVREDELLIHYEDGTCDVLVLKIPYATSKEDIMWRGEWGYTNDINVKYLGNIYAISLKINNIKKICGIELPNCPNIIIFLNP